MSFWRRRNTWNSPRRSPRGAGDRIEQRVSRSLLTRRLQQRTSLRSTANLVSARQRRSIQKLNKKYNVEMSSHREHNEKIMQRADHKQMIVDQLVENRREREQHLAKIQEAAELNSKRIAEQKEIFEVKKKELIAAAQKVKAAREQQAAQPPEPRGAPPQQQQGAVRPPPLGSHDAGSFPGQAPAPGGADAMQVAAPAEAALAVEDRNDIVRRLMDKGGALFPNGQALAKEIMKRLHPRLLDYVAGAIGDVVEVKKPGETEPLMGVTHVQKFVRVWPSNAGEVDAYHQEVERLARASGEDGGCGRIRSVLKVMHMQARPNNTMISMKGLLLSLLPRGGKPDEGDHRNRRSAGDVHRDFCRNKSRVKKKAQWNLLVDLVIDRLEFKLVPNTDPHEPWRITLQSMLLSNSENLQGAYHIVRWEQKIERAINDARSAEGDAAMRFDPDDEEGEQKPSTLRKHKVFKNLSDLGNKLQLYLYTAYQLGRHWLHFKREADPSKLKEGWDVLSAVEFTQVVRQMAWYFIGYLLNRIIVFCTELKPRVALSSDKKEQAYAKTGVAALEILRGLMKNHSQGTHRVQADVKANRSPEDCEDNVTLTPPHFFSHLLHNMYGPAACQDLMDLVSDLEPQMRALYGEEGDKWEGDIHSSLKVIKNALSEAVTQKQWNAL